eukprot:TRINITY_DN19190_c0_g1_i1.p1 TRINITY_DN19190_c0_g1~~TRINITY_DN19190_c0_g1_i1.p1  ORF type:complete len:592 (+),score=172.37 TRINITY_DN19190_c0_g1_i1:121-1896(+)
MSERCRTFLPQKGDEEVCVNCDCLKEEHSASLSQQFHNLGFTDLSKEDPTEVFELLEMIGTGAYGSVFMGRELSGGEVYAIKFLELEESKGNDVDAIVNEIKIMKESLECPYIVEYRGVYSKDDVIMLVMEYCSCSVEDILSFCPNTTFLENQVAAVCASIIKGLAYLHAYGIAHRDIKSGNVLLKDTGEVKLADFGVAHKVAHERDKMKTLAGSPYWCAPELITADSYDNKVDIWACGIVALEMAEGRPPYWEMEPLQVIFHIPKQPAARLKNEKQWSPDFVDFIDKCLQKDPAKRATALQLLSHPFVLSGSSRDILIPLVNKCLPIIMPAKQKEMEETEAEQAEDGAPIRSGTMLTVDKSTMKAAPVPAAAVQDRSRASTLRILQQPQQKKLCFGIRLEDSIKNADTAGVKHFTDVAMSHLISAGLDTEGIFRVPGDKNKIQEIKLHFDHAENLELGTYYVHDVANALKLYFRELPEPLMTYKLYGAFIESQRIDDSKKKAAKMKSLIEDLPQENKKLLYKLVIFLAIVATHAKQNKMPTGNLARCFGPNLLSPKGDITPDILLRDSAHMVTCIQILIDEHETLFGASA